ncbi:class I SAM-dependent methyltransferase [Ferrovibrio xuzhouensis]|uniref:Class I SAM-dependent methyltransferase n=1 Tax=Ferrovibrio xuzhouensis TaxID=1576914 RepID=A0ABV7VCG4_9PROT
MGALIDFLQVKSKPVRDLAARRLNKDENRELALKFDVEYFDGSREQGYGGYRYDGRWVPVAHRLIEHYNLRPGDRVLDIGCAKGFLVKDLREALPGLDVWGLDVSGYALRNAVPEAQPYLIQGSCDALPFPDADFKLAISINTAHNLELDGCARALREMSRVAPAHGFVQVDAYRDERERQVFEDWMLTARTYLTPAGWRDLFAATGYRGDYFWTILKVDDALRL